MELINTVSGHNSGFESEQYIFNATPKFGNILFAKLIIAISTKHPYVAYTNSSEIELNKSWVPAHLGS